MQCFAHPPQEAVGSCKFCFKAVCHTCLIDTGKGLACCEGCKVDILESQQMTDKAKSIYRIGKTKPAVPLASMFNLLMGLIFLGYGIYMYRRTEDLFILAISLPMLGLAAVGYFRAKKLNMNS